MITEVVADVQLVDPTEFRQLYKHFLVETEKVFEGLHFVCSGLTAFIVVSWSTRNGMFKFCYAYRMAIDMLYQDCRGEGRPVVQATAPIRMAACSDFEIKRTINFVLFRSMDTGKMFCHYAVSVR